MERLSKYLARCGVASRRKAEELILNGQITVNGVSILELGTKINPEKDKIAIDEKIVLEPKKVYYILNKPKGYTSTVKDPYAKKTVLDLLPSGERIFPVGRLDKDTKGLLLVTNDGELTNRLTHPKFEKEKEYLATVSSQLSTLNMEILEKGIEIDGKKTKPARIKDLPHLKGAGLKTPLGCKTYSVTIKEGRNRQVRLMFAKIGHPVLELKRIRVDFLTLGNLKEGEFRNLTEKEIKKSYEDKK